MDQLVTRVADVEFVYFRNPTAVRGDGEIVIRHVFLGAF